MKNKNPKRRCRLRKVGGITINEKRISKKQLRIGRLLYPETDYWKPTKREHCSNFERPCPFVSCKHHLYLDVNPATGSIKINFPDLEVWEMDETCVLDIANQGGVSLEETGKFMNLTRERIRMIEIQSIQKIRDDENQACLKDYH